MSVSIAVAVPAEDLIFISFLLVTVIFSPPAVTKTVFPFGIASETAVQKQIDFVTTCLRSSSFSSSLFSGFKRFANVLAGILAKASLFGAKRVNGPSPLSVSIKSAAVRACKRVENFGFDAAPSTILGTSTEKSLFI